MKPSELLDKPEKWIKGDVAIDTKGDPVASISSKATSWCVVGALNKCYLPDYKHIHNVKQNLKQHLYINSIPDWNDAPERTFEEVRAALIAIGE